MEMGKVYNIGFVAIVVAVATRYFVATSHAAPFLDFGGIQKWEVWLYTSAVFWFLLAFWNVIVRRRCPQCKAYKYSANGVREIDRWVGTKKVRERVGDKSWGYRSVSTTFVKIASEFRCLICGNVWTETHKQEKN